MKNKLWKKPSIILINIGKCRYCQKEMTNAESFVAFYDADKTKSGRIAKKGLYYYMNKRKKAGTSRKGKGTVSAKALKRSAKTARS